MTTSTVHLQKLSAYLGNFNADTANMALADYDKTTLKIGLLHVVIGIRNRLEKESNRDLNQKFKQLKIDFKAHVEKKIRGEANEEDDLLFEVREVSKLHLAEAKETVIKDLENSSIAEPLKSKLIETFRNEAYNDVPKILSPGV